MKPPAKRARVGLSHAHRSFVLEAVAARVAPGKRIRWSDMARQLASDPACPLAPEVLANPSVLKNVWHNGRGHPLRRAEPPESAV